MRLIPSGTPSRTKDLSLSAQSASRSSGHRLPARWEWPAALSVAVVGGAKTVASPGPLSSAHAPRETRCATCHSPAVVDVRCEYCHDPFGSNRYRNAGHVWFGTKDPVRVSKAAAIDCAQCHSDHHGRDARLTRVDERDCARCHFSSMSRHPEFAWSRPA